MDYSQFLNMFPEATLMAILVIVFLTDFAFNNSAKKHNMLYAVTGLLMAAQIAACAVAEPAEAFGGLYVTSNAVNVMKIILTAGTLIVIIMAQPWLQRADVSNKEGEFYELVISTLLGMYMMMSSGHFLMFFLGLEMASVPMACLVAFDKLRKNSAEGAAKFILTATFSSGVMLYGISFIYGAVGTLYFEDVASLLYISPMTIMGLVFFFSGLGFKISLVPFHFWTADTYQGAPTAVTGYLSVISKGAASFTLMTILMKVFAPMVEYWEYLLYIVIVLSITIANLFAIRQKELKRFMAFSSISQAGYIMLAVVGNSAMSVSTLTYYVLVYVVANMSVFTVINIVEQKCGGKTKMDCYDGFYQTNPKLALLMTLALFSLAGIPPFAGMFSKFFVFMAAASQGSYFAYGVVFIALINTVVSLYYYLLIVKAMYIKTSDTPLETFKSDCNTRLALALCTAGILAVGVFSCVYDWIAAAAN
ncbi:MAG: NADH-quinone oxidoreductase subunit N [Prevotella sp.]|uniref:NADH-quinone oxidoreductase subunit N n=1 Tax=Prevotella sp. PTAC TaxID=2736295 RepID=UPI001558195E|nr:NADH-quinone oxidoreductase subunit N [Prevotella sp. PTAC]MCX4293033.1 NADH-quinone oxidoreductase subunit N [Prevotella sp.]NPD54813.1 NADH-quinone oxidoreductase subunit N [Prevotella sp. PTAC]